MAETHAPPSEPRAGQIAPSNGLWFNRISPAQGSSDVA